MSATQMRPGRRRPYYGWVLATSLGIAAAASYGVLLYSFAALIVPMGEELGWSQSTITGAHSLSLLVAAAAAIPVGMWVDRYGGRAIMTAGAIVGAAGLLLWAAISSVAGFYLVALLLGVSMATLFYEPSFAVIATWFERRRGRALTVLTLLGGLASITFIPLTSWLVASFGWRTALQCLALILAGVTIPIHGLVLRRRPADLGLHPDGDDASAVGLRVTHAGQHSRAHAPVVSSLSFAWLATSFALNGIVTTAIAVHLIPLLLARGEAAGSAALAMGVVGFMAVPGRLLIAPLADRVPSAHIAAALAALQATGLLILILSDTRAGIWCFVVLFGAGSGAGTTARAAMQAELYGSQGYGAVGGALALAAAVARAAAPVGASLLLATTGSYDVVLGGLLVLAAASGVTLMASAASARALFPRPHTSTT